MALFDNKRKDMFIEMLQCPVCGSTNIHHGFRIHTYECEDCGYAEKEEQIQEPYKILSHYGI